VTTKTPFRVHIDAYSGPLDLLLYLVRRQELDILDLPVGKVVGPFLEFLDALEALDVDELSEFVVLASTLLEIKSRSALPQPEEPAADPDLAVPTFDPRTELVQRLLEYKQFRDAAKELDDQAAEWQLRYPRLADDRPKECGDASQDRIKDVELWDLVSALSRVLKSHTAAAPPSVVYDDTPISTYIEQIRARVLVEQRVAFTSLFEIGMHRSKITGIFLAILELLRHYHFRAEQPEAYGEIWVMPPADNAIGVVSEFVSSIEEARSMDGEGLPTDQPVEPTTEA
jgi:segregation and condensation protein A